MRMEPIDKLEDRDSAQGQSTLPLVELPHKFYENGVLVTGSSPEECSQCGWKGDPRTLLDRGSDSCQILVEFGQRQDRSSCPQPQRRSLVAKQDAQRSVKYDCASCRVSTLAVEKLAMHEMPGLSKTSIRLVPWGWVSLRLDHANVSHRLYELFSPTNGPRKLGDIHDVSRRHWTHSNISCKESTRFAKERIEKCLKSHEICRLEGSLSFLPTRMICVDAYAPDYLDVRLEDSSIIPRGSRYVTLSYCWGDYHPECMTTSHNLRSQMKRISWATMPATFRDAAAFTRSLGLRYLWIDSICIIQQDPERGAFSEEAERDWINESATMSDVYKNSYVILAALYGQDSRAGLRQSSNKRDSIAFASLKLGESTLTLFIRPRHFLDNVPSPGLYDTAEFLSTYPLLTRAWAFQERIVSPRVLFFTQTEMIFQCCLNAGCECGALNATHFGSKWKVSPAAFKQETSNIEASSTTNTAFLFKDRLYDCRIEEAWREDMASTYSGLKLSQPRDRLPALGAIAKQFQDIRSNESYLAGLWSGTLHEDLLWSCKLLYDFGGLKTALNRPYSLPSWSWASLPTQVGYIFGSDDKNIKLAKVIRASCNYAGDDYRSGILQSSTLILRTRALQCLAQWQSEPSAGWFCTLSSTVTDIKHIAIHMDHDGTAYQSLSEQEELYMIEIAESTSGSRGYLLLRIEDPENSIYTRAGIIFILHKSGSDQRNTNQEEDLNTVFDRHSVMEQFEIR